MEIGMMIVFLTLDLFLVGICWAITSRRDTYEKGMLLGVHIPPDEAIHPEAERICSEKQRANRRFQAISLAAGVIVSFLNFVSVGLFIGIWVLWLTIYLLGIFYIMSRARKKMYQLKKNMGWGDDKADGDEYWRHGWYSNPEDKRLLVEDRTNSTSYSFNMARPLNRFLMAFLVLILILIPIGIGVLLFQVDHAPVSFQVEEQEVRIASFWYECEFSLDQVREAELIYEMPDDSFRRTNGASTPKRELGYYRGEETGDCMMFLYDDYTPILYVDIGEIRIFLNSQDAREVESWYDQIA